MSKLVLLPKAKVVALPTAKKPFTPADFLAPYGDRTTTVMNKMLDNLYREYKKSQHYQYLSFGEKVDVDFQLGLIRQLISHTRP